MRVVDRNEKSARYVLPDVPASPCVASWGVFWCRTVSATVKLWTGLFLAEAHANIIALYGDFWPKYIVNPSWSMNLTGAQMQDIFRRTELEFVASNLNRHWKTPKWASPARTQEIANWIAKYGQQGRPLLMYR